MRRAAPQRTGDQRWVGPTPVLGAVCVWGVVAGIPAGAGPNRGMAPAVSAQNPPTGLSLVIFEPLVWTMRQPPKYVPKAMAALAARMMGQCMRPQLPMISCLV